MNPEDQIRMLMQEIEMLKAQLRDERAAQYQAARPGPSPYGESLMAKEPEWARREAKPNQNFKVMPHRKSDEKPGPSHKNMPYIYKEQKPGKSVGLL